MHCRNWMLPLVAARTVLAATLPVRVVSFNIRYDASDTQDGEFHWWDKNCPNDPNWCRAFHLFDTLNANVNVEVPVVGLQEVLDNQLGDILYHMGATWAHIGVGRDDGGKDGEYSPILYKTDVLNVVFSETKWLSPTPDEPSGGWGEGSWRIVTLGVFEHKATGKRFIHANTHLDNVSAHSRTEGIKLVVARIQAAQATYGPLAVTLTGDFNSGPGGDAYETLKGLDYVTDTWDVAKRVGTNQLTYTGFKDQGLSRIDFVWFGPNNGDLFTASQTEIVNNVVNGIYISDHRLIYTDLVLN